MISLNKLWNDSYRRGVTIAQILMRYHDKNYFINVRYNDINYVNNMVMYL